jgi:hypothetical protein
MTMIFSTIFCIKDSCTEAHVPFSAAATGKNSVHPGVLLNGIKTLPGPGNEPSFRYKNTSG